MTTGERNNDAALAAYVAAQGKTRDAMKRIGDAVEAHEDEQPPERIHWGHVGDLDHVIELLARVEGFLKGTD